MTTNNEIKNAIAKATENYSKPEQDGEGWMYFFMNKDGMSRQVKVFTYRDAQAERAWDIAAEAALSFVDDRGERDAIQHQAEYMIEMHGDSTGWTPIKRVRHLLEAI